MKIADVTVECRAPVREIWDHLTDYAFWPRWDPDIAAAELRGPFAVGAAGLVRRTDGRETAITVTAIDPLRSFSDAGALPLAQIVFTRKIASRDDATALVTFVLEIKGVASLLFYFLLGKKIGGVVPSILHNFKNLMEETGSPSGEVQQPSVSSLASRAAR